MKKLIFVILCLAFVVGCDGKQNPQTTPDTSQSPPSETTKPKDGETATILDYFPFEENVIYMYEGTEAVADSEYTLYNGYVRDNKVQRKVTGVAHEATEVLQYSDGELKLIYGDTAYYFYDDITNAVPNVNVTLLKEPLEVGNKWAFDEGVTSQITNMTATVETPYGTFEAMEITNTKEDGRADTFYYSKGIGLVKTTYSTREAGDITSSLKDVVKDTAVQVPINAYYINTTTNETEIKESSLLMNTNDNFGAQLEALMKKPFSEEHPVLLTEKSKIGSINIDREKDLLTVDFAEFQKDSAIGDGIQNSIVKCIANTVGNFYDVSNVELTIKGKPFESGDIKFKSGEYLKVEKPAKQEQGAIIQ